MAGCGASSVTPRPPQLGRVVSDVSTLHAGDCVLVTAARGSVVLRLVTDRPCSHPGWAVADVVYAADLPAGCAQAPGFGGGLCGVGSGFDVALRADGDSMQPTYPDGTVMLARRFVVGTAPKRGDVVVFTASMASNNTLFKRVIGIPGDWVEIDGKHPRSDGKTAPAVLLKSCERCTPQVLSEPYLPDQTRDPWTVGTNCCDGRGRATAAPGWLQLPRGDYFLLSDNRNRSDDSRQFGMIPADLLIDVVVGTVGGDGRVKPPG